MDDHDGDYDGDNMQHDNEDERPALSLPKQSKTAPRTSRRASSSPPGGLEADERGDGKASPTRKSIEIDEASKPRSDGQRGLGRGDDDDVDARLR